MPRFSRLASRSASLYLLDVFFFFLVDGAGGRCERETHHPGPLLVDGWARPAPPLHPHAPAPTPVIVPHTK
jgi:hypothetical protein